MPPGYLFNLRVAWAISIDLPICCLMVFPLRKVHYTDPVSFEDRLSLFKTRLSSSSGIIYIESKHVFFFKVQTILTEKSQREIVFSYQSCF